jgi:hypothetical protein
MAGIWYKAMQVGGGILLLAALSGCQSSGNKAAAGLNMNDYVIRTTPLMVTRGTNGTTLAWESQYDEQYTVQIRDGHYKNSKWINHPRLTNIQGTGGRLETKDNPGPTEKRKYRLLVKSTEALQRKKKSYSIP